jgi:hypothetical protein
MMIKAIGMTITNNELNLFPLFGRSYGRLLGGVMKKAYLKDFK